MTTIYLDNEIQVGIFLTLYEYPKGLSRDKIAEKLDIPRTTIYDNIIKILAKNVNNIPYIKVYTNKITLLRGRPKVYYYIPKGIRIHKLNFKVVNNEKDIL